MNLPKEFYASPWRQRALAGMCAFMALMFLSMTSVMDGKLESPEIIGMCFALLFAYPIYRFSRGKVVVARLEDSGLYFLEKFGTSRGDAALALYRYPMTFLSYSEIESVEMTHSMVIGWRIIFHLKENREGSRTISMIPQMSGGNRKQIMEELQQIISAHSAHHSKVEN